MNLLIQEIYRLIEDIKYVINYFRYDFIKDVKKYFKEDFAEELGITFALLIALSLIFLPNFSKDFLYSLSYTNYVLTLIGVTIVYIIGFLKLASIDSKHSKMICYIGIGMYLLLIEPFLLDAFFPLFIWGVFTNNYILILMSSLCVIIFLMKEYYKKTIGREVRDMNI